jgi:superfamily II DNA or RNA helicase
MRNDRVSDGDADRQTATAAEILHRLDGQPGLVLADEVGMGKTYVALAVAVSVLEATKKRRPVVIMVPSAVAEKWPTEWAVFSERCLQSGHGIRASSPVRNGSDFLKLLNDPARTRKHLIFVTHGALTSNLTDPFIKLAIIRQATAKRPALANRRRAVARYATKLLANPRFGRDVVDALFATPPSRWRSVWNDWRPQYELDDEPVPASVLRALKSVDLQPVRDVLTTVPVHNNASLDRRLKSVRRELRYTLTQTWKACLGRVDEALPLLVLDEAHHVKNANQLSRLLANEEAEADVEALQSTGPLGGMFERMLFMTATPFQLGHNELINVLDRFHGVRWPNKTARTSFDEQLDGLRTALDRAQASALRLERAWTRIDSADAPIVAELTSFDPDPDQPESVRTALEIASTAAKDLETAEALLRPWVIRHVRADKAHRRRYLPGAGIIDEQHCDRGLSVGGSATLPFLLAARAQALSSLSDQAGATRSYFAYGLASSFEAYADTRRNRAKVLDDDTTDDGETSFSMSARLRWYLDRIQAELPDDTSTGWAAHPKVASTVERVRALWNEGDKSLVFCFYVETGKALRTHVSRALRAEVVSRGAAALSIDPSDEEAVLAEFDRIGERLLRSDTRGFDRFRARVASIAGTLDDDVASQVADIVIRFMRTPSFLVRFVDLGKRTTADHLLAGLEQRRLGGTTLAERIRDFSEMLAQKVDTERDFLIEALNRIQTGGITATTDDFDESERSARREALMPNVRLANGGVQAATRQRLMLAFNTPFFPEVLVASSVMAEGVDLHRDCRHVIHHDLDWNPSTLEQRTGRVDRIGSRAERIAQPVVVYEPYLAGTHDEKMFRVVKDRERWFGVVMGETPDASEWATERQAARVPLPTKLAAQLTMDLSLRRA